MVSEVIKVINMASHANNIPPPVPLKVAGDAAADWERFKCQFENYGIATDLVDCDDKKLLFSWRELDQLHMRYFVRSSSKAIAIARKSIKSKNYSTTLAR